MVITDRDAWGRGALPRFRRIPLQLLPMGRAGGRSWARQRNRNRSQSAPAPQRRGGGSGKVEKQQSSSIPPRCAAWATLPPGVTAPTGRSPPQNNNIFARSVTGMTKNQHRELAFGKQRRIRRHQPRPAGRRPASSKYRGASAHRSYTAPPRIPTEQIKLQNVTRPRELLQLPPKQIQRPAVQQQVQQTSVQKLKRDELPKFRHGGCRTNSTQSIGQTDKRATSSARPAEGEKPARWRSPARPSRSRAYATPAPSCIRGRQASCDDNVAGPASGSIQL